MFNSRRQFLKLSAAALAFSALAGACSSKAKQLILQLSGAKYVLGHRLWAKNFPKPSQELKTEILIVGGGITGLSAARTLTKIGKTDFLLCELENQVGGNSRNGENKHSKFPLGAHYLPLPNKDDAPLIAFLQEAGIVRDIQADGTLIFDETQLVFDPEERLFIKNNWQDGIIPKYGISADDQRQIDRFLQEMESFRRQKNDDTYSFAIPITKVKWTPELRAIDQQTMKQWCLANEFASQPLLEYVDYCCRDDFGLGIDFVSAYAGIHYFAARKFDQGNEHADTVLTWPEGNARLKNHLLKYASNKTLTSQLVYDIKTTETGVEALVFDEKANQSKRILAQKVLVCTPQYVNKYLFEKQRQLSTHFNYAPWLVAAITLRDFSDNFENALSWDNVIHGGVGLGYINNRHQELQQQTGKDVVSYYRAFSQADLTKARKSLYQKSADFWKSEIINDLKIAHPNIESFIEEIEIYRWGHGMISPTPGFLSGNALREAAKPIDNKIFFAHTDLSGISIFEEAFHQGIHVVENIYGTSLDS